MGKHILTLEFTDKEWEVLEDIMQNSIRTEQTVEKSTLKEFAMASIRSTIHDCGFQYTPETRFEEPDLRKLRCNMTDDEWHHFGRMNEHNYKQTEGTFVLNDPAEFHAVVLRYTPREWNALQYIKDEMWEADNMNIAEFINFVMGEHLDNTGTWEEAKKDQGIITDEELAEFGNLNDPCIFKLRFSQYADCFKKDDEEHQIEGGLIEAHVKYSEPMPSEKDDEVTNAIKDGMRYDGLFLTRKESQFLDFVKEDMYNTIIDSICDYADDPYINTCMKSIQKPTRKDAIVNALNYGLKELGYFNKALSKRLLTEEDIENFGSFNAGL